jgi:hypothetical protein
MKAASFDALHSEAFRAQRKTGAFLEAVTDQPYIAVLIASLVGRRAGRSE